MTNLKLLKLLVKIAESLDKLTSSVIRWERTQMKGTQTMSKIKQSLPEDTSVLTGAELDGTPDKQEPSPVDWAIAELNNAIGTLEKSATGAQGYVTDLKDYRQRLQGVIDKTLKPF